MLLTSSPAVANMLAIASLRERLGLAFNTVYVPTGELK